MTSRIWRAKGLCDSLGSPIIVMSNKQRSILLAIIILSVFLTANITYSRGGSFLNVNIHHFTRPDTRFYDINLVDCQAVYLDVGTNVATQIRKLYTPESFPGARSVSIFESVFSGIPRGAVCTFGFEPNPQHENWLNQVENSLKCRNFNVKIFTQTAVHTEDGSITFYRDLKTPEKFQEWGASLTNWQNNSEGSAVTVSTIDLASFTERLLSRLYPQKIPILMKMDVEGAEYGIMEKMLSLGVLCQVSGMTIEWHPRMALPGVNATQIYDLIQLYAGVNSCNFRIMGGDDESFQTNSTSIPLKKCNRDWQTITPNA